MSVIPRAALLLASSTCRRGIHSQTHHDIHTVTSPSLHPHDHRRPLSLPLSLSLSLSRSRSRSRSRSLTTCRPSRPRANAAYSARPDASGRSKSFKRHIHTQLNVDPRAQHHSTQVDALLAALRQNDTLKLYFCLLDLTRRAEPDNTLFCYAIQTIPPTTFSEILRSFDPFHIAHHVDSAPGIPISWGAAIFTPLGELINKWGVKILYVRIFNRLRLLQRARRQQLSGPDAATPPIRPLLHDYVVMLRCAGATSNIGAAKDVWYELLADGYSPWKHAELYAEFIKARYLTESLYANNDLARFRVAPLDMHRNGATRLERTQVWALKNLRSNLLGSATHRFGQNVQDLFFAEPLTRLLRRRRPLKKLQSMIVVRHMVPGDETLLCAILKANGRNAQGHASNLLMRFWGIDIGIFKKDLGRQEISGGYDFAPGAAQAPTEALLDAVVHCYGNMGELRLANALVDFISRRWNIAVPDSVWSDLLAFTRIHSTEPAAREWRIVNMPSKITTPGMVIKTWWKCTQAPHTFQPEMRDYDCLVKSMLRSMRSLSRPLDAIRQLTSLYDRVVRQMQDAWADLVTTTQQGVPNHAAYRRYRLLQSSKHYIWYCFHYTSRQVLKCLKPATIHDHNAVRLMPNIVAELEPFMTKTIEYRLATGIVELHLDNQPLRTALSVQELEQPAPWDDKPAFDYEPKEGRQNTASEVRLEQVDWTAFQRTSGDGGPSVDLQNYLDSLGLGHAGYDRRSAGRMEEDEEAEDLDVDHNVNFRDEQHTRVQHQGKAVTLDGPGKVQNRVLDKTSHPGKHLPDAFEESRSSYADPSVPRTLEFRSDETIPTARDPFEEAFASSHSDNLSIATSPPQDSDDWAQPDSGDDVKFTLRKSRARQLLDRPAYMMRPRHNAPPGEPSMVELRKAGEAFTGFHRDPLRAHYAAHRIVRRLAHAPGVPVDLSGLAAAGGLPAHKQLMEHLLWVQT